MYAAFASSVFAAPQFTLDPTGAGLTGAQVTADNVIVSNYSTVRIDQATGSVLESGFLSVQSFELGSGSVSTPDLNSNYSLFIGYEATGTQSPAGASPTGAPTTVNFNSLDYVLYGASGTATFTFDADHNVVANTGVRTALAMGELLDTPPALAFTFPDFRGSFTSGAFASVTFASLVPGFFSSPDPFFSEAATSFVNRSDQVSVFDGGFSIVQGGGSFAFVGAAAPIPEPQTYALMLAGLAAMGFVVRRRSRT
jgi:hypothetical protein